MFNHQQQLFETLLGNNNLPTATTSHQQVVSNNNITHNPTIGMMNNIQFSQQPNNNMVIANSNSPTTPTGLNSHITNESLLQQQLLYNQLVLMNQALSQNILMNISTPNNNTNHQLPQQTMYHNTPITPNTNTILTNTTNCVPPPSPSLLSVLSSLTAKNPQQPIINNSTITQTNTYAKSGIAPTDNSVMNTLIANQPQNLNQEMEDVAKPWLFMLENMLKQRPTSNNTLNSQYDRNTISSNMMTPTNNLNNLNTLTDNTPPFSTFSHSLMNNNSTNSDVFSYNQNYHQPQYSGFSRESNLSPSIFQELDDIIGSIDPNVDICEKLSFDKKEEKLPLNVIVKPEENINTDLNTSSQPINETITPIATVTFTPDEKKKKSKRTGQGRGGNTGGKYLAESASREVSPKFDYLIHNSDSSIVVKADFDGIILTPQERCLCALLSKAVLPKEDLKSLITGPNSVTLRCIISKWVFGKLDVSTSSYSVEESTGSDQQIVPLSMVCDPMGFTVNKSAKPTRLSVFVNDTLKLRIRPCAFEKSPLFNGDTIIADISIFDQNMMNLFIGHYSIEMRSAHYLTGLAGGLSKESDLSTTNIMNTPDICMELLSDNSIVQFTEDLSKSNKSSSGTDEPFDVCVSVRRDHHYKVKLPPIKEVSMSLGFGNTSPNSALNKKISFIQIVETDSQRPVCRSEPFWCRSKSRAEMEKKQNREAMQRKTVKKDGEKKRKVKSPTFQDKKRKLDAE